MSGPISLSWGREFALKVLKRQVIISLIAALLVALAVSPIAGLSWLVGTTIWLVGYVVFSTKAFKRSGAQQLRLMVKDFYWGEAAKMLITVALFAAVFATNKLAAVYVLLGYIVSVLTFWWAALAVKKQTNKENDEY